MIKQLITIQPYCFLLSYLFSVVFCRGALTHMELSGAAKMKG